jgi:glyoxylase-like metal-dependent hydrolase (beta-lactamase superfamily II)
MEHPRISVGRVGVSVVCEGYAPLALGEEFPRTPIDWEAERADFPWMFHDAGSWAWHVHAFVLRTPTGVVMVDAGVSPFPPYAPWATHTPLGDALVSAGAEPAEVRLVVHTHLHADHAGGAVVDGRPRYPNARHLVHRADWQHFSGADDAGDYVARHAMEVLERSGRLDLDPADREVWPGIRVVHSPGHTPGHRSVILTEGGETLLLTGDALHTPPQVRRPDALSSHDEDPGAAGRSRTDLMDRARIHGWRVAVSHFARPFGRVGPRGWRSEA